MEKHVGGFDNLIFIILFLIFIMILFVFLWFFVSICIEVVLGLRLEGFK